MYEYSKNIDKNFPDTYAYLYINLLHFYSTGDE